MRMLTAIIAALVGAYAVGFTLTVPLNPEARFWRELMSRRDAEIVASRAAAPDRPAILFAGGSSTAFSIDPVVVEEACGFPAFNLGLPVGAGPWFILDRALNSASDGDILVVCMEPDALIHADKTVRQPSKLAFALATMAGEPSNCLGGHTFDVQPTFPDHLNLTRPGAVYLATFCARIVTGKSYRYTMADYRYHGRLETQVVSPSMEPVQVGSRSQLGDGGRMLLQRCRDAGARRGIEVLYSMPWQYTHPDALSQARSVNSALLGDILSIVPVLDDGYAGATSERALFSDTSQHLTEAGARARSRLLASELSHWVIRNGHDTSVPEAAR